MALWPQGAGRRQKCAAAAVALGAWVPKVLPQNHLNHPHSHSHVKEPGREPLHCEAFLPGLTLKQLLRQLCS